MLSASLNAHILRMVKGIAYRIGDGVIRAEMKSRCNRSFPSPTKHERLQVERYALRCHHLNQALYARIMKG